MAKILITGGSGLVGKALSAELLKHNHEVVWLSRTAGMWQGIKIYQWQPEKEIIDLQALQGVTHLVHLAGAGVMDKRWTEKYKKDIYRSRVESMKLLISAFKQVGTLPQVLIGTSATGFYGSSLSDEKKDEFSTAGSDFLADICKAWENSYTELNTLGVRTVIARFGIILSANGGAYPPLRQLANFHISSAVGTGKQYFPWIHIDDIVQFICLALFDSKFQATYNLVAPGDCTNAQFANLLSRSLHKSVWTPSAPAFIMHLLLGERAASLVLGARAVPRRLLESGFSFKHRTAAEALFALHKTTSE